MLNAQFSRRNVLKAGLLGAGAVTLAACGSNSSSTSSAISTTATPTSVSGATNATAIAQVFGEGRRLTGVALEYPSTFTAAEVPTTGLAVGDRTIVKAYTNASPDLADSPAAGNYIIIELDAEDTDASMSAGMTGGPGGGPGGGAAAAAPTTAAATTLTVTDAENDVNITTSSIHTMIADDFEQFSFTDPATGMTVPYNLYTPKDMVPSKDYPLVVFIHDASVVGTDVTATLYQGNGAIVWASPEDQEKNPAYVLAPQFAEAIVDDTNTTTDGVRACMALIDQVVADHNIDTTRLYTTGQSMGGMTSIAMNVERPTFFAASYLVACQWDTNVCQPLADDNLWITVSEGDTKAYPGQNAITALIDSLGTPVTHKTIRGDSDAATYTEEINEVIAADTTVNYTTFEPNTLPGLDAGSMEHMSTWRVAYNIPEIREWIMKHSLEG
ncbi:MAG: PHB depolymerase family esterase [Corynebacterium sp.]|nr:PHB depolymerase family esterase [Corynebacterium sp.]